MYCSRVVTHLCIMTMEMITSHKDCQSVVVYVSMLTAKLKSRVPQFRQGYAQELIQ